MDKFHNSSNNIKRIKETFEMFDEYKDGTINLIELNKVLKYLNYDITEIEVTKQLKGVDLNEDGRIEFEEFFILIQKLVKYSSSKEEALLAFQTFDPNKTGKVYIHELKTILKMLGDINDKEIEDILNYADINEDGTLEIQDFVNFIFKDFNL